MSKAPTSPKEAEAPIGVIQRSFHILEILDSKNKEVSLAELSESTQLNKPTLCRMLQALLNLGYVEQNSKGEYSCSEKLSLLGQSDTYSSLKESLQRYVQEIYQEFNETVNLGILKQDLVHYVYVKETSQTLRNIVEPGTSDPFQTTALGRAIVAHLPQKQKEQLCKEAVFVPKTKNSVSNESELHKILTDTLKLGYATEEEENVLGACCIAIPILKNSFPIAAISISIPTARLSNSRKKEIINFLKEIKDRVNS